MLVIVRKCYIRSNKMYSIHDFQTKDFPDLVRMSEFVVDTINGTDISRVLRGKVQKRQNEVHDELITLLEREHLASVKYEVYNLQEGE